MFKKGFVIATAFLFILAGSATAQNVKIAIIDVNKVLNDSKEGTDAKAKMKGRYDELQKRLDEKQNELKTMKDDIEKQKIILGKEKVKAREEELEKELVEFRKIVAESEKEMRDTESAFTQTILQKIKSIVDTYADEKGIELVIDRSGGVVYAEEEWDITAEILEILNKEFESASAESK